jgi:hypothetical protein
MKCLNFHFSVPKGIVVQSGDLLPHKNDLVGLGNVGGNKLACT